MRGTEGFGPSHAPAGGTGDFRLTMSRGRSHTVTSGRGHAQATPWALLAELRPHEHHSLRAVPVGPAGSATGRGSQGRRPPTPSVAADVTQEPTTRRFFSPKTDSPSSRCFVY